VARLMQNGIAVIDLGSNSGRVVALRMTPEGHLEVLSDARAPLRLAREIVEHGEIGKESTERILTALRDFLAVIRGAGVSRIVAVATSAFREARDAPAVVARIRAELGIRVEVIDGDQEAAHAFLGAIHGLPVERGLLFDIGGGSLEVTRFVNRGMVRAWTLPLGSLRLSDTFLESDPPHPDEISALRSHVLETLQEAGIPRLGPGERLAGTGGTVRNLARVDERRHRHFLPHLHGYVLTGMSVSELLEMLATRKLAKRQATPGLNADRADSVVGGAVVVQTLMDVTGAADIVVSGQGLREGIALGALGYGVPPPSRVRQAALGALTDRFATWDAETAKRRVRLARSLATDLVPDAPDELLEMMDDAAWVVDLGRAVDYYDRFEHAARMVFAADLVGFSHRHLAAISGILREGAGESLGEPFRSLLGKDDRRFVTRAGTILTLADEVERRTPPDEEPDVVCQLSRGKAIIKAPVLAAWQPRGLAERFRRAFRRRLSIEGGA
jgi:exopolyphosphatase/guanosine-5'-triphosphate,3'-diphosphate pyrophosphatase